MHKTLKQKIAYEFLQVCPCGVHWTKQLSECQRILNNDPKKCTGWKTPHEIYYGRDSNTQLNELSVANQKRNTKHLRDMAKVATIKCNQQTDKRCATANKTPVYNVDDRVLIK